MTLEEIKIRRLANQHLISPTDYMSVVRDLCGVQAQFMSNAMHAIKIRSTDFDDTDTSALVKNWSTRGTVHVFAKEDLPLFLHKGRSHYLRPCDTLEADDCISKERKAYFSELIVDSIRSGINTREELKAICTAHGMTEREGESVFNSWGGTIRALCERGSICHVVQEKKAFAICPPFDSMSEAGARLELTRRYFTNFGPATIKDAAYFFGATQAEVKKWLAQLPVESAECDGKIYFYIDAGITYPNTIPDCIFLAGFDQLMLGYRKDENPFLPPEHLRGIFNLAGIVMPAVLLHGKVVGKWKKKGQALSVSLFEPVCPEDRKHIENRAASLWPDMRKIKIKEEIK